MAPRPLPRRLFLLSAVAARTASATPASRLFSRADTCAAKGLQSCSKDLPDQLCCPNGSVCIPLAGATTVLCCPSNRTCDKIQAITCNIRAQDLANNQNAPIQTTVFDVALPKCGSDLCCPFGFSCTDDGKECTMDQDQSKAPKAEQPTSSPSRTTQRPTSTPITTSIGVQSTTSAASATPSQEDSNAGPERTSIIGGAVGGGLVLLLLVIVILCIRRRRRNAVSEKSSYARSNNNGPGPYGNVISAPVLQPGSYRSDFLRGSPSTGRSFNPDPQPPPPRPQTPTHPPRISIPNPFDSPDPSGYSPPGSHASYTSHDERTARAGRVVGARLAPIRAMKASEMRYSRRPSTQNVPSESVPRPEASSESINVFADPSTVHNTRGNRTTTLSDMMEQAGLGDVHHGRPYVPGTTPRL